MELNLDFVLNRLAYGSRQWQAKVEDFDDGQSILERDLRLAAHVHSQSGNGGIPFARDIVRPDMNLWVCKRDLWIALQVPGDGLLRLQLGQIHLPRFTRMIARLDIFEQLHNL